MSKLIKYFSRQLLAKAHLLEKDQPSELKQYPRLKQWLLVVGLGIPSVQGICQKVDSLEDMMRMSDHEIRLTLNGSREEDERRLLIALNNLRKYIECLRLGKKELNNELHWDSWEHDTNGTANNKSGGASPQLTRQRISVPYEETPKSNPTSPPMNNSIPAPPWSPAATSNFVSPNASSYTIRDRRYTPPPTPPTSTKKGEKMKFPTTPPPRKRHQTAVTNLLPETFPLTKSKSHESQLGHRVDVTDPRAIKNEPRPRRERLHTEPGLETEQDDVSITGPFSLTNSPMRMSPHGYNEQSNVFDEGNNRGQLIVPPSPRTPTHFPTQIIPHKLNIHFKKTTCDYCRKPFVFGFKCKTCKYRCHRDCVGYISKTSCIQVHQLDINTLMKLHNDGSHSPIGNRINIISPTAHKKNGSREHMKYGGLQIHNSPFHGIDTSSNTSSSSCNSSTPSSPASSTLTPHTPPIHFDFGEVNLSRDVAPINKAHSEIQSEINDMLASHQSNDSDKTMSGTSESTSTDSEKTLAGRVDSQDSQISDMDSSDRTWPRQNSLSFREWEIPYNEMAFGDIIGTGRFGTVRKGNWHGEIAIKVFNMDQADDENNLEIFKQEVAAFRKTRHENLVLFVGTCIKPPHFAIVTRLYKGMTLYTHIHLRQDRFTLNRAITIAQQITQGMGYLHSKGVVHKDLKTKNIFIENGKVVITDYGLFRVTKLCRGSRKGDWLTILPGWLCYLSPEIICCLRASNDFHDNDNIPFTEASDVYAFGTIWYELVSGEWPFKGQPPESIIWQVGKGMKPSLASVQGSKEVKEILMQAWSFECEERPPFSKLSELLEKLPKKRLARSPSHPVHLSRSAESVF